MITFDLAAHRAAIDFLFRLPATFISRFASAGIHQPRINEQFPQTAQRRIQRWRQRLASDQLRLVQRQQFTLVRHAQRFILRRRQRRNHRHQQPQQRPGHVS
ncbi:hypothetical protein ACIOWE_11280 [Pseudomonas sp. NPDC087598]|uniref:hypothetical protein n=1 Tax=Pseudomonas sp. NPDC087598 TaxID=3364440 RepID=UPI00382E08AE